MKNVTIEFWQVEKSTPNAKAIRRSDPFVARMAELIAEFGFKLLLLIRGHSSYPSDSTIPSVTPALVATRTVPRLANIERTFTA